MNVGLLYTPVSIYQMTRGALVLFVGVLSVLSADIEPVLLSAHELTA